MRWDGMDFRQGADGRVRKRKAESHETNERLSKVSKRLSLLNLELNGQLFDVHGGNPSKPTTPPRRPVQRPPDNDVMQVDNTAHKVYIYNLDDELSDSDSSSDEKLIFLPDIEKHLRNTRIPPQILANSEGELAGRNLHTDLVLYNVPNSLSVPEDRDSVRKAIIETRARAREKQRREQERARTTYTELTNGIVETKPPIDLVTILKGTGTTTLPVENVMDDSDAMDVD